MIGGIENLPDQAEGTGCGRFVELPWRRELFRYGHAGHHTGAASVAFIRECIVPLLRGDESASRALDAAQDAR